MTKRIIVADDDADTRKLYNDYIKMSVEDLEVDKVPNGEELVEKVKQNKYSLVITDNEMGRGIDGLEATRRIREFDKNVPIYMISGSDIGNRAVEAGVTVYTGKNEMGTLGFRGVLKPIIEYLNNYKK